MSLSQVSLTTLSSFHTYLILIYCFSGGISQIPSLKTVS
nr:MAG TPA: hypothetical protein [Caudoviricetes sp.]